MTPNDITTILTRLGRIEAKLDTQHEALSDIRSEVKKTNGRVTALEALEQVDRALIDERQHMEEQRQQRIARWIAPVIVGLLILTIGAALVAGLNIERL